MYIERRRRKKRKTKRYKKPINIYNYIQLNNFLPIISSFILVKKPHQSASTKCHRSCHHLIRLDQISAIINKFNVKVTDCNGSELISPAIKIETGTSLCVTIAKVKKGGEIMINIWPI